MLLVASVAACDRRYDCTTAEFNPDIPNPVKQACREARKPTKKQSNPQKREKSDDAKSLYRDYRFEAGRYGIR
jgi:hypothetical protein